MTNHKSLLCTLYIVPLSLILSFLFASCDNEPAMDDNGALKGLFTVNEKGTKVRFSRGNLQYQPRMNIWRFAENQWDFIGDAENGNVSEEGVKCDNSQIADDSYARWIDLFGYGTGKAPTESSCFNSTYPNFSEWGNNAISNGGDKPYMWRTLKKEEWAYLFFGRDNADKLFCLAKVNGVKGTILLPDNWAGEKYDYTKDGQIKRGTAYYENPNNTNFTFHTYEGRAWDKMEKAGAVFLPAAGFRSGKNMSYAGSSGGYWSDTPLATDYAYSLLFDLNDLHPQFYVERYYGRSVRLVR